MWPQALQMSREECRGILRRLELESYSTVISVFRAQGGLSENKLKLLEELRNIFHISQERHRAEARRVANDEQLSTIAEAISGPNTWQEWSREGRRTFPMLPRVAPQTALALIANNIANEVASENAKLPYPAETGLAVAEDQKEFASAKQHKVHERNSYNVVTNDPFKMPEIPALSKKNLKRNITDHSASAKKRLTNDNASPSKHDRHNNFMKQNANQLTTPPSNIRKLYNSHTKLQRQQQIQQQQQTNIQNAQPSQKITKQKMKAQKGSHQLAGGNKRQITPAKVGRRSQKMQQHEMQLQQQIQQQLQQQQQLPNQQATFINNMSTQSGQQLQPPQLPDDIKHVDILGDIKDTTTSLIVPQPPLNAAPASTIMLPLKKDLPKIYTKLQTPTSPTAGSAARLIPLEISHLSNQQTAQTVNIVNSPTQLLHPTGKLDKQNLISTPVQKYIVEDRQQQAQNAPLSPLPAAVVTHSQPPATVSSVPQIMTLPQISGSAASACTQATKLRAVSTTTILPTHVTTGAVFKQLQTKKLTSTTTTVPMQLDSPTAASGSSALFNIVDSSNVSATNTPTHTVPAIIQLQSSEGSVVVTQSTPQQPLAQGKVLTTKLMPIVLSGSGNSGNVHGGVTKLDNAPHVPAGTIIKSLPASAVVQLSGGTQATGNSSIVASGSGTPSNSGTGTQLISSLAPGTTIFRKAGNLFKATKPPNPGGPQIISNIKLTPVSTSAATTQSTFLKNIATTGLRTSVKICQSPNGKVFIQPANLTDPTKVKLQSHSSNLQHKLLPNSGVVNSSVNNAIATSAATAHPQRIAIQKVQIIPGPLNSPNAGGSSSAALLPQKPTSLTLSNKSNMIFVPATGANSSAASGRAITISKTNLLSGKTGTSAGIIQSPQDGTKSNVVVIGTATTPNAVTMKNVSDSTILYEQRKPGKNNNQLITEDTPVDIINMPIIVEGAECNDIASANENDISAAESLTVLAAEPQIQMSHTHNKDTIANVPTQQTVTVLGATDWEMELDQAQAQQAKAAQNRTPNLLDDQHNVANRATVLSEAPIVIDHDNYQQEDDDDDIVVDAAHSVESIQKSEDEVIILGDDKHNMLEYATTRIADQKNAKSHEECYIVIDDKLGEAKYQQEPERNSSTDSAITYNELSSHNTNALIDSNDEDNTSIDSVKDDEPMDIEKPLVNPAPTPNPNKKTIVITNIQTITTPLTTQTRNINMPTTFANKPAATTTTTPTSSLNETLSNSASIANLSTTQSNNTPANVFTIERTDTLTTTTANSNNNSNATAITTNNTQTVQ